MSRNVPDVVLTLRLLLSSVEAVNCSGTATSLGEFGFVSIGSILEGTLSIAWRNFLLVM